MVAYFCSCEGHNAIMASSCSLSTKSWVHSGRSEFTIQVMTHLQLCSGWRFGNHSLHPKLYKSFFKCLGTFSLHAYNGWHGGAAVSTVAMQQVGLGSSFVVSWGLRTALWYLISPIGLQRVYLNLTHTCTCDQHVHLLAIAKISVFELHVSFLHCILGKVNNNTYIWMYRILLWAHSNGTGIVI